MKFFSALFLCLNLVCVSCLGAENDVEVNALSAVLMDFDTGAVLWEKDCDKPMAMASTTKIMTAIIALENGDLNDIVTASKNAAAAPPVKMYLKAGEEIRLEDLLYALMLQSSNDAAVAVAEHIGGSVDGFCDMMNKKAAEIGCSDTVFRTPNGLDKDDHHSTARDMAMIARYALANDEFVRIINTRTAQFKTNMKSYSFANKDRLLTEYDGAIGVKTGFTGKAGHCFVGAAKRGDRELISVVLASGWGSTGKSRKWSDTKAILDYGFENFEKTDIIMEGEIQGRVCVDRAKETYVNLCAAESFDILANKNDYQKSIDNIEIVLHKPDIISAPVKKGRCIGTAVVYQHNVSIGSVRLAAENDIEEFCFDKNFGDTVKKWFR